MTDKLEDREEQEQFGARLPPTGMHTL
jgi:hypothetical protein